MNRFTFTTLTTDITRDGLPMFYRSDVPVELNKDGLSKNLTFNLRRPMGKLGVYAAKPEGESGNLRITGLTMLASGTRTRNYLMPQVMKYCKALQESREIFRLMLSIRMWTRLYLQTFLIQKDRILTTIPQC